MAGVELLIARVLSSVSLEDAALAGLDSELVACLKQAPDGPAPPRHWLVNPASPPTAANWRLTERPFESTLEEIRRHLADMPTAQVERLLDLATAHVRHTHRGCDAAYMHMALSYFVGVWILDHVIDDVLHNNGFGHHGRAVLAAMTAPDPELLPVNVPNRADLARGIGLVALCRSRLADVLTPEGAAASWVELCKWHSQIVPDNNNMTKTARAQSDPAVFVPYRVMNSGMPWVLLTVWHHRSRSALSKPPIEVARVLRALAFVTALYNDLVSIPEDLETGACNGVLMLISAGLEPSLPEAIDRVVDWHNRALVVLQRLIDEVDDPTLRDLCEGFIVGMVVWQNVEVKYTAGARALVQHGQQLTTQK